MTLVFLFHFSTVTLKQTFKGWNFVYFQEIEIPGAGERQRVAAGADCAPGAVTKALGTGSACSIRVLVFSQFERKLLAIPILLCSKQGPAPTHRVSSARAGGRNGIWTQGTKEKQTVQMRNASNEHGAGFWAVSGLPDHTSVSNVVLRSPKEGEQSPEVPWVSEEWGAPPGD